MAENVPATVRKFKDMLKAVPSKDFGQLYGSKKVEASMSMSNLIAAKEVNKEGTFRGTVTRIEPWPFPQQGVTGWRLAVEDILDQRGGHNQRLGLDSRSNGPQWRNAQDQGRQRNYGSSRLLMGGRAL